MDIKPITREEMYLAKAAGQDVSLPEPVTRKEMFLAKMAGMEVETTGAFTRLETFAKEAAVALNRSVIEPLKITENGTYTAPEGVDGYNPVTVEVVGAGGGSEEWIGDGNTHIWITLHEGRTSPMLGVCPNGTVTVDWGDGTATDVLKGTSTSTLLWTPTHNYDKPGDYIITLSVDGNVFLSGQYGRGSAILRHSDADTQINNAYEASVRKVEIGNNVTKIDGQAFTYCYNLEAISIPNSVTLGGAVFTDCYSLRSVAIPSSVTTLSIGTFQMCVSLTSIVIPNSINSIGKNVFNCCYSMAIYDFTNHTTVPTASGDPFNATVGAFEIRVPSALYDEWVAATNWAKYASCIVAV